MLVLCTALIAPYFIDWSTYRTEIERYGSRLVGRDVKIEGPVRFQILPTPVMSISDFRIANVEGGSAESFLAAKKLEVRVALSPLLKGEIEVESLLFDGATVELERVNGAGSNWDLSPKMGWAAFLSAEDIGVNSAMVTNSVVVFRDGTRGGVARLENVDLEVSAVSLAGPYRIRGTVRHEEKLLFATVQTGRRLPSGDMRVSVTLEPDGEYKPVYGFDGKFVNVGGDARIEGKVRIRRDLPPLAEDSEPLDTAEIGLPFAFKSNVRASFSEIVLDKIEFLIDQAQPASLITGEMRLGLDKVLRLDVGLDARHIDFDRLAERGGLTPDDFAPSLALVESVTELVEAAPDDLRGTMRLTASALTIGGETVKDAQLNAEVAGKSLKVSRIAGVLPGRSRLELSDLEFAVRGGVAGFEGDLKLASRDTRGFMKWALPATQQMLLDAPRAFKGVSELNGRIAVDTRSLGVRQAAFVVDGTRAAGALLVVPGKQPEFFGNIVLDTIDFDRYLPKASPDERASGVVDPFAVLLAGLDPQALTQFNGRFVLEAGAIRRWGLTGEKLRASIEIRNGGLILKDARVEDFHGADIDLAAGVFWENGVPRGQMSATLNARRLLNLVDIPVFSRFLPPDVEPVSNVLGKAGTATVQIELHSASDDGLDELSGSLKGLLGGVNVNITSEFSGDVSAFHKGRLKFAGTTASADAAALLKLIGLETDTVPSAPAGPGEVNFSLIGTPAEGMNIVVEADFFDTQFDVRGLVTETEKELSTQTEIIVTSDDGLRLVRALRLLPAGALTQPIAVDVKGLVSVSGDEIVVTGLGGKIAGIPIGLDGTANISGARPKLFGNLTIAQIDVPWVVARALSMPVTPRDQTAVPWSADPFGFEVLQSIDLNLAVRAGEVTLVGDTIASQLRAEITLAEGGVHVEHLEAGVADGKFSAEARLDNDSGQLSLAADFALNDAEFASTLATADGATPLKGRYTLTGNLSGAGRSPIGLISSLTGAGRLHSKNAVLDGVNPDAFSKALLKASKPEELDGLISDVLVDGQMMMSGFDSAYDINNGIVRFARSGFDAPSADGDVKGVIDLPAWRLATDWKIALKSYPSAPALTVVLAGAVSQPARSYNTTALRSFLTVKGLTEGVQQLEKMQREENERIKQLDEMERKAKLSDARHEEEQIGAVEPGLLVPLMREPELLRDKDAAVAEDEKLVRTTTGADPVVRSVEEESTPTLTGTIAVPQPELPRLQLKPGTAPTNTDPLQVDQVPLQPLPSQDAPNADDVDADIFAQDLLAPVEDDTLDEENEQGPTDISPRERTTGSQDTLFSDDPSSWRK